MAKAKPIEGLDAHAETRAVLPAVFGTRITELWSMAEHLPYPERVRELHDMRIAAKRLRYCFEFFAPCFADLGDALKRFKRLQDYLGDLHDCDVWVDYLRAQLRDAFRELTARRRELGAHTGASADLGRAAAELEGLLTGGPVQGLLMMIGDVVERRERLYGELLLFWAELERSGFREELTRAVAAAARGEEEPE